MGGLSLAGILAVGCKDTAKAPFEGEITPSKDRTERKALELEQEQAELMEIELIQKQRFYQAIKAIYEGPLQTPLGNFKIRLILIPNLPPSLPTLNRIRTPEEVTSDLSNLYFKAQIIQWNPIDTLSLEGCQADKVYPDLTKGEIAIYSETCPNIYILRLSEFDPLKEDNSALIANDILSGKIDKILTLYGKIHPLNSIDTYTFSANRTLSKDN